MVTASELLDLVDAKVQFRTPEGDYEGVIARIFPKSSTVRVQYLYYLPKRVNFGCLNFRFHEITILKVLTPPPKKKENVQETSHSYMPTKSQDYGLLDDFSDFATEDDQVEEFFEEQVQEKYTPQIPRHLSHVLPVECEIIDEIDETFYSSIEHIKDQERIGLSLEGSDISRNGEISFLNIATRKHTLLFDIKAIGEDVFNKGLKSLLENPKILKVIHDCRLISDCLYHKYNIRLCNVFDTQAGDLFYRMLCKRKLLNDVSPLNICLAWYLEIPDEALFRNRKFEMCDDGSSYYGKRPISQELFNVMVHNVIYLLLLQREVEMGMNAPFRRAVGIYLNSVQASSDRELLIEPHDPERPPKMLFMDDIKFLGFKEHIDIPHVVSSGPPYRKISDPEEVYRDCLDKYEMKIKELSNQTHMNNKVKSDSISDSSSTTSQDSKYHLDHMVRLTGSQPNSFPLLEKNKSVAKKNIIAKCSSVPQITQQKTGSSESSEMAKRNSNKESSSDEGTCIRVEFNSRKPVNGVGRGGMLVNLNQCPTRAPGEEVSRQMSDKIHHVDWSAFQSDSDELSDNKPKFRFVPAGMGC